GRIREAASMRSDAWGAQVHAAYTMTSASDVQSRSPHRRVPTRFRWRTTSSPATMRHPTAQAPKSPYFVRNSGEGVLLIAADPVQPARRADLFVMPAPLWSASRARSRGNRVTAKTAQARENRCPRSPPVWAVLELGFELVEF